MIVIDATLETSINAPYWALLYPDTVKFAISIETSLTALMILGSLYIPESDLGPLITSMFI